MGQSDNWVEPEVWYAQLPAFFGAAAALMTDPAGRVLLVKPTYRDHWLIPGGYIESVEYPHDTVVREIREELNVQLDVGPLLVIDWAPPAGKRPRAIVNLLFDGGTLYNHRQIQLKGDELDDYGFFTLAECAVRLPAAIAPRVPAGLRARRRGRPAYLFAGVAHPSEMQNRPGRSGVA